MSARSPPTPASARSACGGDWGDDSAASCQARYPRPVLQLRPAHAAPDLDVARTLIREYADSLGGDLSVQDFAREVAELPGDYAPQAGSLTVAWDGEVAAGGVG